MILSEAAGYLRGPPSLPNGDPSCSYTKTLTNLRWTDRFQNFQIDSNTFIFFCNFIGSIVFVRECQGYRISPKQQQKCFCTADISVNSLCLDGLLSSNSIWSLRQVICRVLYASISGKYRFRRSRWVATYKFPWPLLKASFGLFSILGNFLE